MPQYNLFLEFYIDDDCKKIFEVQTSALNKHVTVRRNIEFRNRSINKCPGTL